MTRILSILMLCAMTAGAQTVTNRCAVDIANRSESERDYVPAGDWTTNNLRLWLPFLVSPTNSTTYDVGDCSPWRSAVTQTNVPSQPVWTNGAMRFTGSNFLDLGAGVIERRSMTVAFWTQPVTGGFAYVITDATMTSGVWGVVVSSNTVRSSAPGSASNTDAAVSWGTGWTHVAVSCVIGASSWQTVTFVNGAVAASGRVDGLGSPSGQSRTRIYGRWQSANAGSAVQNSRLTIDDLRVYLTNLTPAQIGAVYSNGLGRARP